MVQSDGIEVLWFGHVTVIMQRHFQQHVDFLVPFSSVPRQSGGLSSCMQILVRTVHTVQQTVEISQLQFLGLVVDAPVAVQRQVLRLGLCRKLWSLRSGSFGFVQFLDKVAVPVGATTGGCAMLGSTMDKCSASPGWLLEVFMIST